MQTEGSALQSAQKHGITAEKMLFVYEKMLIFAAKPFISSAENLIPNSRVFGFRFNFTIFAPDRRL
jgi:hypothetical protein